MAERDDGGPAFPLIAPLWSVNPDTNQRFPIPQGMSLRDYFAGQALVGLAQAYALGTVDDFTPEQVAREVGKLADAMLKARK